MKKITFRLLSMLFAASLFVTTACNTEEDAVEPVPTVTIPQGAPSTAKVGDAVTFNVAVVAQSKIKSIETRKGTTTLGAIKTSGFTNSTSDTYPFSYTVVAGDAGKTLEFAFIVIDTKDRKTEVNYSLAVASVGSIRTQTAKLLYGQDNNTGGSFYSTEATGNVYKQADAKTNQAKVDFLYFYGATNFATIAAPSDDAAKTIYNNATTGLQTWTTLNSTKFKEVTMTPGVFNEADFDAVDAAASGATLTKINSLAANKVIGFITASGKKGLILVNSVNGTATGSIDITIKVQD